MHTLNYLDEAFGQKKEEEPQSNQQPEALPPQQQQQGLPGQEVPPEDEQGLSPEETQELEFDALKKYIIFTKIRELKDKIENIEIVVSEEYKKILYFLNIIMNFFDLFEYDQLVGIVDEVVLKVEKLDSNANNKKSKIKGFRF
ncbi:MAG: hypothetical protein H8D97_01675 [Proteobacteria bacterium]|nr:hypothetical protein [Pseudomonadota bacterium]